MNKKVIDLMTYKIEKSLKNNGYVVKKDENKKVKILIKINASNDVKINASNDVEN